VRYHFDDHMMASFGTFVSTNSLGVHLSATRVVFGRTVDLVLSQEFSPEGRSIPGLSVATKSPLWTNMVGKCGVKMGGDSEVTCSILRHFDKKTVNVV